MIPATIAQLGPTCLVAGCAQPRLTYGHACAGHTPGVADRPQPGCVRPLRCYCDATPECLGHPDNPQPWQRPMPMPDHVRDQLDAIRRRRAAQPHNRKDLHGST